MGIILKGGEIITATDRYKADVRIEEEKVIAIGDNIVQKDDEVIDVQGCYLLPGGIDTHTHFDLEVANTVTADDFESGTKAAIVGGTTTVLDYATQNKGETLKEALKYQFNKAKNCYCDYGFHMGMTDWNVDVANEMKDMIDHGVTSFKLYMAYKNTLQVDDSIIYQALTKSKEVGGLIAFHCENGDLIDMFVRNARKNNQFEPIHHALTRPKEVEKEAITRLLQIAEMVEAPVYVVHLSSKLGLDSLLEARKRGVKVYIETCPQYLLLDDSNYKNEDGAKYVMSPPLRKKADQEALWKRLESSEIQTIGTDHCSFNYKGQKELGKDDFSKIPNGAPGVEHRLGLLYTYGVMEREITLNQMVALTSTNAAKIFGLFPEKGTIACGSDADIVVWDPNYQGTIKASEQMQNVDYTPYEGLKQYGKVKYTFLRGHKVVMNGKIINQKPLGQYLHRKGGN